jgi:hypothetical protein
MMTVGPSATLMMVLVAVWNSLSGFSQAGAEVGC